MIVIAYLRGVEAPLVREFEITSAICIWLEDEIDLERLEKVIITDFHTPSAVVPLGQKCPY